MIAKTLLTIVAAQAVFIAWHFAWVDHSAPDRLATCAEVNAIRNEVNHETDDDLVRGISEPERLREAR